MIKRCNYCDKEIEPSRTLYCNDSCSNKNRSLLYRSRHPEHREKARKRVAKYRKRYLREGKCIYCGAKARDGMVGCWECNEYQMKFHENRI